MGQVAIDTYDIDVTRSYMVGDSDADMEFGNRLGCNTIRVSDGFTFKDAVNSILFNS